MDDKKKFVLVRLSEAAQLIQTYPELIEYAEEAATVIQGPWTQELFDAAKQLPTNGGTADIVAISKEIELSGGTVSGGLAMSGSIASGGIYEGRGALTVISTTAAILAAAAGLGLAFAYLDNEPYYEAEPEAWNNIVNDVASTTLIEEHGVPVVVTPDGKTYLAEDFVNAVKNSLYSRGYLSPYTINPFVTGTGLQHYDLINLPYPLGGIYNLGTILKTKVLLDYPNYIEDICKHFDKALDFLNEHLAYNLDFYYPIDFTFSITIRKSNLQIDTILSVNLLTIEQMDDFSNTDFEVVKRQSTSPYTSNPQNIYRTFGRVWTMGIIGREDIVISNNNIVNNDNTQTLYFSDYENVFETTSQYRGDYTITGFGEADKNIPDGTDILKNSLLPGNNDISTAYPSWSNNGIDISNYNPNGEPLDETRFIPVEMPLDVVTTGSNQKQSQSGEVRTIPQEIPLIGGQSDLNEIMNPDTPTPPSELPDPLTEPIPEIDPVSPTEQPDAPVDPDTDPEPSWVPDPPFEPDPPTDPNPDPDSPPVPIPVPTPIPAPTNPPAPPVDDGTSPVIVLPPVDPNNGIGAVYNPTRSELRSLSQFLWSTNFIDQIKKLFQSPVDGIISLHQIYVSPVTGGSDNIYCGYLDSGVSADVVTNQFVTLPCGSVVVPTKYNNALDYSPYTKVSIYLPFVGIRELDADDVIGATVDVTYRVDVLNGACLASVKCSRNTLNAVLYTFEGNCSVQLPVSGATFGGPTAGAMVATAAIVGTAVTGGAASTAIAAGAGGMIAGSKTNIQKSGNFSGNAGALGSKIPYIIVTRPIPVTPVNYHLYYGLPSHVSVLISSLTGYTRVKSVHIDDVSSATDEEKRMIESILKNGFIA